MQLGRLLYESERFPLEDFIQLLSSEIVSLKEAIECLEASREGTNEAIIHYKSECALHEAEVMLRDVLTLRIEICSFCYFLTKDSIIHNPKGRFIYEFPEGSYEQHKFNQFCALQGLANTTLLVSSCSA